jgi:membrane protease YdiL (CAAX protease family)
LLYFASFFVLFLAVPLGLVLSLSQEPALVLKSLGFAPGRTGRGILIAGCGAPLAVLAGYVGSRNAALRRFYPFSKKACRSDRTFLAYETAYLCLYYLPWEFLYRGLLFFPLVPSLGLVPALSFQTIVSTLHHLGHPVPEVFAALGAGFLFGGIAYVTNSIFYPVFLHALVGISTDFFVYRRDYRGAVLPAGAGLGSR